MARSGDVDRTAVSSMLTLGALQPRLSERLPRAASTRMRRIICAAIAKNCARSCHSTLVTSIRDLIDQSRGLERVALALILHIAASHDAQFAVHVLREPPQRSFVTAAPGSQEIRDFLGGCVD